MAVLATIGAGTAVLLVYSAFLLLGDGEEMSALGGITFLSLTDLLYAVHLDHEAFLLLLCPLLAALALLNVLAAIAAGAAFLFGFCAFVLLGDENCPCRGGCPCPKPFVTLGTAPGGITFLPLTDLLYAVHRAVLSATNGWGSITLLPLTDLLYSVHLDHETFLLLLCLLLAALALLKHLGFLKDSQDSFDSGIASPGKTTRDSQGSSDNPHNFSLRQSSVMAQSLSVGSSRILGSHNIVIASPVPMKGSMLKSQGVAKTPLRVVTNTPLRESFFSPQLSRATMSDGEVDGRFVELLKAITYSDAKLEQSAYGFSVSAKKASTDGFPWIDSVLAHGPADTKLKPHERVVRLNSESTKGWSAERFKRATLASPMRLLVEVEPPRGFGASRQELLYRGRLGRVYVLCQRCKGAEECQTSCALLHFLTLLEHADSIDDLRVTLIERTKDVVCPEKERQVLRKILAHALPSADGVITEPLDGPSISLPNNSTYFQSPSKSAGTSALSTSMLESQGRGRESVSVSVPETPVQSTNERGMVPMMDVEEMRDDLSTRYNILWGVMRNAEKLQDELVTRYNMSWKASSAQARIAQDKDQKLSALRDERDKLREENKKKDDAIFQGTKMISDAEQQMQKDRDSLQQERKADVALLRQQLQEMGELGRKENAALQQQLAEAEDRREKAVTALSLSHSEFVALREQVAEAQDRSKREREAERERETERERNRTELAALQKQLAQAVEASSAAKGELLLVKEELVKAETLQKQPVSSEVQGNNESKQAEVVALQEQVAALQQKEISAACWKGHALARFREAEEAARKQRERDATELAALQKQLAQAVEASSAAKGELLLVKEDLENAREQVDDLQDEIAGLEDKVDTLEKNTREMQDVADSEQGALNNHIKDIGTILTYLNSILAAPVEEGEGSKTAEGGDLGSTGKTVHEEPSLDDLPQIIRSISSRIGPRHVALLREGSALSGFASSLSPTSPSTFSLTSDSASTSRHDFCDAPTSPPFLPLRSFSELHRTPAELTTGSIGDQSLPGLSDITSEAVAALFAVKQLLSKKHLADRARTMTSEEANELEERFETLNNVYASAKEEADQFKGKYEEMNLLYSSVKEELEAADAQRRKAEEKAKSCDECKQAEVVALQEQVAALQQKEISAACWKGHALARFREAEEAARKQRERDATELAALQKQLARAAADEGARNVAAKEACEVKEKFEALNNLCASVKEEADQFREKYEEMNRLYSSAKEEIEAADAQLLEAEEALWKERERDATELAALQKQLSQAVADEGAKNEAIKEANELKERFETLNNVYTSAKEEADQFKGKYEEMNLLYSSVKEELEAADAQRRKAEEKAKSCDECKQAEVVALQEQVAALQQKEISAACWKGHALARFREAEEAARKQRERDATELAALQKQLAQAVEASSAAKGELLLVKEDLENAREQVAKYYSTFEVMASKEANDLKEELAELKKKLDELTTDNDELDANVFDYGSCINQGIVRIQDIAHEMGQLQVNLHKFKMVSNMEDDKPLECVSPLSSRSSSESSLDGEGGEMNRKVVKIDEASQDCAEPCTRLSSLLDEVEVGVQTLKAALHDLVHTASSVKQQTVTNVREVDREQATVQLLKSEIRDVESLLEQEKRECGRLKEEIAEMDRYQRLFEEQLQKEQETVANVREELALAANKRDALEKELQLALTENKSLILNVKEEKELLDASTSVVEEWLEITASSAASDANAGDVKVENSSQLQEAAMLNTLQETVHTIQGKTKNDVTDLRSKLERLESEVENTGAWQHKLVQDIGQKKLQHDESAGCSGPPSQTPARPSQTPGQTSQAGTAECETGWMAEAFGRLLPATLSENVEVVQKIQDALTAAKIGSEQELLAMTREQMKAANIPISARPHLAVKKDEVTDKIGMSLESGGAEEDKWTGRSQSRLTEAEVAALRAVGGGGGGGGGEEFQPGQSAQTRGEVSQTSGQTSQTSGQTSQTPARPSQTPGQTSQAGTAECETGWMAEAFGRLLPATLSENVEVVQKIQDALTAAKIGSEQELLAMTREQMKAANIPISARPHFGASSRATAPAAVPTTQSTRPPDLAATDSAWAAAAGDGGEKAAAEKAPAEKTAADAKAAAEVKAAAEAKATTEAEAKAAAEKAAAEKATAEKAAGGGGGKQAAVLSSSPPPLEQVEEEMKTTSPVTPKGVGGVGMIVEEGEGQGGVKVLRVKSLIPNAPAISCGMIAPGDYLITVDGKKVTSVDEATKVILGELGSSITMQFERDDKRFVVDLCRGKAASFE